MQPLLKTEFVGYQCKRGKVRDLYDLGDRLVMIATDRISAFDWVMPNPIPGKGKILTEMSLFWFQFLGVGEQLISSDPSEMGIPFSDHVGMLAGRAILVKKTEVIPFECVVRGYLAGSAWKEYRESGEVAGIKLPPGMKQASRLPEPIFTPATKAETGHDINITYSELEKALGIELASHLRQRSMDIFRRASIYAGGKGLILADTKFEFGILDGKVLLIDEILTPDSSRYWSSEEYRVGESPASFDKQFMRDWLETTPWDKQSPPPELPKDIVDKTLRRYQQARNMIVWP